MPSFFCVFLATVIGGASIVTAMDVSSRFNGSPGGVKQLRAMPWAEHSAPSQQLFGRYLDPNTIAQRTGNKGRLTRREIRENAKDSDSMLWFRLNTSMPAVNLDNVPEIQDASFDAQSGKIVLKMNSTEKCKSSWPKGQDMLFLINPHFQFGGNNSAAWRRVTAWSVDDSTTSVVAQSESLQVKDFVSDFELHVLPPKKVEAKRRSDTVTAATPRIRRRGFFDKIGDLAKKAGEGIKDAGSAAVDGIKDAASATADVAKDAAGAVKEGVKDAASATAEVAKDAAGAVKDGAEKVVDKIVDEALDHDFDFNFKSNNKTSINLFANKLRFVCADCEGSGRGKLSVDAKGLLSDPQVRLTFEGELNVNMGFDVFATAPLNIFSRNISLVEVPIFGLSIPNVVSVGPVFKVEMATEAAILNVASMHTGFQFQVPPFKTVIGNIKKTPQEQAELQQEKFDPKFTVIPPTFKDATTTLQMKLGGAPQLQMGVSFLNTDIGAGIAWDNAIFARVTVSAKGLIEQLREAKLPEKPEEAKDAGRQESERAQNDPSIAALPPPPPPPPATGGQCGNKPKFTIDALSQLAATVGIVRHVLLEPLNKNLFEACAP
ncbi:hypothetical protein HK102_013037 [Quaeritorhiza haematococci]|nr:hypothetical protein HK102_013037 [Quaeritorhiza haematococci]